MKMQYWEKKVKERSRSFYPLGVSNQRKAVDKGRKESSKEIDLKTDSLSGNFLCYF